MRNVEEATDPRALRLLAEGDPTVRRWLPSHRAHERALQTVLDVLAELGARTLLLRHPHAAFDPADAALVVTVGGDGTLLAASHCVGSAPLLGVNSDPRTSVGFFCAAHPGNLRTLLTQAVAAELSGAELNRMRLSLNGRVLSQRVLNDVLFCHTSPAATSRYLLRLGRNREEQRSSGLWVGPAAGSTAAQSSAGGRILPLTSRQVQFVVREPYEAPHTTCRFVRGLLAPGERLVLKSKMHDARLFIDGPHDEVVVSLGDEVVFESGGDPLTVLGLSPRRRA